MISDIGTAEKLFFAMEKMESAMALYYRECSKAFAEEYDFFHDIELQELAHEKNIVFILDEIRNKPEEFSWKMPIDEGIVEREAERMRNTAEKIANNKLTLKQALNLAMTEEKTVMESNYPDIIDTKNEDVNRLLNLMNDETTIHYSEIEEKLREIE